MRHHTVISFVDYKMWSISQANTWGYLEHTAAFLAHSLPFAACLLTGAT